MFETNDVTEGWNGKTKHGTITKDGVYFWIAKGKSLCSKDGVLDAKGTVQLVR